MVDAEETIPEVPRDATPAGSADPVFAADGTDLSVIRWMLAMSPEDRIRWLQTHMSAVASIRHSTNSRPTPDSIPGD